MRVLVVCQYFPPEVGAPPNRLGTFAHGLADRGHEVTVVCEQPNHPRGVFAAGYGHRPLITERDGGLTVHRVWVAASPRKTTARRLAFYASFAVMGALRAITLPKHDVVFMSSPPLPAVITASWVAGLRRTPYVLDVRDLWPAAAQALGELSDPHLVRLFERAERRLYRGAGRVTTTTRPFMAHIDRIAGEAKSAFLPNGAMDHLIAMETAPEPDPEPFVVGYAGNLGIAQGLDIVLDAAERLRGEAIRFVLVGEGPLAAALRAERERRALDNVEFRPGVDGVAIGAFLQSCHALLVPLRNDPLLRAFVPSKLYDAMAVGRPALVAAPGEAAALVRAAGAGVEVRPEDGEDLARAVRELLADPAGRAAMAAAGRRAAAKHSRSRQLDTLADLLESVAVGMR